MGSAADELLRAFDDNARRITPPQALERALRDASKYEGARAESYRGAQAAGTAGAHVVSNGEIS